MIGSRKAHCLKTTQKVLFYNGFFLWVIRANNFIEMFRKYYFEYFMLKEIKYFIKAYGFWIFTQKVNVETNKFANKFQKYLRHFGRISNTVNVSVWIWNDEISWIEVNDLVSLMSKWSLRETIVFDRRQRIKWSPQKLWCSDQWSMNLDSSPFQGWDTLLS